MKQNHNWTYEEVEYCTEELFKSFVINREYDYEILLDKLFIHFDMKIKKESLKMFFQDQKHLFQQNNVPNTLTISPLTNASSTHKLAFNNMLNKYAKMKINDRI